MRKALSAALPLALAACGGGGGSAAPAADDASRIDCALAGAAEFSRACWVERLVDGAVVTLVFHSDAGTFRRLTVVEDGRGLAAADGADPAQVSRAGDLFEISLAGDRYRLPITMAGADGQP